MDMKLLILIGLVLVIGCRKKEDAPPTQVTPTPIQSCNYVITNYSGSIVPGAVTINLIGDPITKPADFVQVSLHRPVPPNPSPDWIAATNCSLRNLPTPPCSANAVDPYIDVQSHKVVITDAHLGNFDSYEVSEAYCQ